MKRVRASKRPTTARERLLIAQAQLRAVRHTIDAMPRPRATSLGTVTVAPPEPTGRYIQITSIRRGFADILHALDDRGQVWELKTSLGDKIAGQPREVKDAWWGRVPMEQR